MKFKIRRPISAFRSTLHPKVIFFDLAGLDEKYFQLSFPNKTVNDYVKVDVPSSTPALSAFTVCVWVKAGDQSDGGSLFSYALQNQENELWVVDHTSIFILMIGGSRV